MLFAEHLTKEKIQRLNQLRRAERNKKQSNPKPKPKQKEKPMRGNEKLSRRDIENLMGMNRDTYKRERGAMKRR
jgi:hypothetical protein